MAPAVVVDNMVAGNMAGSEHKEPVPTVRRAFDSIPAADNMPAVVASAAVASAAVAFAVVAFAAAAFAAAASAVAAFAAVASAVAAFAAAASAVVASAVVEQADHNNYYCNSDLTSKFLLLPVFSRLIFIYLI